jgi:hypothetical protein
MDRHAINAVEYNHRISPTISSLFHSCPSTVIRIAPPEELYHILQLETWDHTGHRRHTLHRKEVAMHSGFVHDLATSEAGYLVSGGYWGSSGLKAVSIRGEIYLVKYIHRGPLIAVNYRDSRFPTTKILRISARGLCPSRYIPEAVSAVQGLIGSTLTRQEEDAFEACLHSLKP